MIIASRLFVITLNTTGRCRAGVGDGPVGGDARQEERRQGGGRSVIFLMRAGVLEKKWTSVVRLQKKVMDLEAKLGEAQTEIKTPKLAGAAKDPTTWIPRAPARHAAQSISIYYY